MAKIRNIVPTKAFLKDLSRIDKTQQIIIKKWIDDVLVNLENPKSLGKALKGKLKDKWRYRVGNYRIIAKIEEKEIIIILLLNVEHRQGVYK